MHAQQLPSGQGITFLFTDIEGSTRLWELDPDHMRTALARHDELIEGSVTQSQGMLVRPRGEGDSRFAVFSDATHAVRSAATIQVALIRESWTLPRPLKVRIALHTGDADLRDGDYYGAAVNRCARLRSVAHGGQVLLTRTTAAASGPLPTGLTLRGLGWHRLRDLRDPVWIYQLCGQDLEFEFPPLLSLSTLLSNLPAQPTSFVGREQALRDIQSLLASTHLLTLVEPGRCGQDAPGATSGFRTSPELPRSLGDHPRIRDGTTECRGRGQHRPARHMVYFLALAETGSTMRLGLRYPRSPAGTHTRVEQSTGSTRRVIARR